MTHLHNNPEDFVAESLRGFVHAHSDIVRAVPGGVARTMPTPRGQVAVVIGGGSGHFPAFSGLVGAGMAHGAVVGNVFASPSSQQVYSVAREVENGGGVIFLYGNYAGDVLNFESAQERLRQEGIMCESVAVSDDVASAPAEAWQERRGVAGDLAVFKAAAYAAERGESLESVHNIALVANRRTKSLGIAFSGCTLPGADTPLFEVQPGTMEIGMGVHGEPGLDSLPMASASEIADLLVTRLLTEKPDDASDVGVILSGLGSVKYEELYLLFGHVAELLGQHGLTLIEPEVGELVTSFEMAGVSLTLHFLNSDLRAAWVAPAYTAGYRKKSVESPATPQAPASTPKDSESFPTISAGSEDSQRSSQLLMAILATVRQVLSDQAEHLGQVDAVAGDGDHGIGMKRGVSAAEKRAHELMAFRPGIKSLLSGVADAWSDQSGGTSGAIWGVILRSLSESASDDRAMKISDLAAGLQSAALAVRKFGDAEPGDKTIVDSLNPLSEEFASAVAAGADPVDAWRQATEAAEGAAEKTSQMAARTGRSKKHGEKSVGTPDPGALSLALIARAILESLEGKE